MIEGLPVSRSRIERSLLHQFKKMQLKQNVVYVTLGFKSVSGERSNKPSAVAYVMRKEEVSTKDALPKSIKFRSSGRTYEIATDVVELHSYPSVFGSRAGALIAGYDDDAGVCSYTFESNNVGYVVSNAHVAINAANGHFGHLRILNRGTNLFVPVGPLIFSSPMRHGITVDMDLAIFRADHVVVDSGAIIDINERPQEPKNIDGDQRYTYWFSVNGLIYECAYPERVKVVVPLSVDNGVIGYENFWQFRMTKGNAFKGQSGALLCRTEKGGIAPCGIVFGGVSPNFVYAYDLKSSLRRATSRM